MAGQTLMDLSEYYARLSEEVKFLLVVAGYEAEERFAVSIGSEHLLLAMVSNKYARVSKLLSSAGFTKEKLEKNIDNSNAEFIPNLSPESDLNEEACRIIESAISEAWQWKHKIASVHILKACLRDTNSISFHLLNTLCEDRPALERRIENTLKLMVSSENPTSLDTPLNFQVENDPKAKRLVPPAEIKLHKETKQAPPFRLLSGDQSFHPREVVELSKELKDCIFDAKLIAKSQGLNRITDAHMLEAILKQKDTIAVRELDLHIDGEILLDFVYKHPLWAKGEPTDTFSANALKTKMETELLAHTLRVSHVTPDIFLVSLLSKYETESIFLGKLRISFKTLAELILERIVKLIQADGAIQSTPRSSWLSAKANQVLANACAIAQKSGVNQVTDANLFEAIIEQKDLPSVAELSRHLDCEKLCEFIYSDPTWWADIQENLLKDMHSERMFTDSAFETLSKARELMNSLNLNIIEPDLILISILRKYKSGISVIDGKKYSLSLLANELLQKLLYPDESEYEKEVVLKSQGNIPDKLLVSIRVAKVFQAAAVEAAERNHFQVEAIHILLGLIKIAIETEVEFVLNREQDFMKLKSAFYELADELVTKSEKNASKEELVLKPEVSEEVFELLLLANEEASELDFSVIDLNHIAIATLKRLPDEAELLILANQLSPGALIKRLEMCNVWQKHQQRLSPQAILIHLDNLDYYFNEDIFSSGYYAKTTVLDVLSFSSRRLIEVAIGHMRKERRPICIEDLFFGITRSSGKAAEALQNVGITNDQGELEDTLTTGKGSVRCLAGQKFSYKAEKILLKSWEIAQDYDLISVEPEHILLAMIEEHDGLAYTVVHGLDIDPGELKEELLELIA